MFLTVLFVVLAIIGFYVMLFAGIGGGLSIAASHRTGWWGIIGGLVWIALFITGEVWLIAEAITRIIALFR